MNVDRLIHNYFANDCQPPTIEVFDDENIVNVYVIGANCQSKFEDYFLSENLDNLWWYEHIQIQHIRKGTCHKDFGQESKRSDIAAD